MLKIQADIIAGSNKGSCLDEQIDSVNQKLKWKCRHGRIYEATFTEVNRMWVCKCLYKKVTQKGAGSRLSRTSFCEEKMRRLLKEMTSYDFPSMKPSWNTIPDSDELYEIDAFNEELGIGFEFDGPHHSDPKAHSSMSSFNKQIKNDAIKDENAKKAGVLLFRINYEKNIEEEIIRCVRDNLIKWPNDVHRSISNYMKQKNIVDVDFDF